MFFHRFSLILSFLLYLYNGFYNTKTKAEIVREEMNHCGRAGIPFLFGVDFEGIHGFFVEKPLSDPSVYFTIGTIGHYKTPLSPIPKPRIKILHSSFETYQEKFRIVHQGLSRGDSFLLNLTERTPIETNLTLEQIFYHSQTHYKLLLPDRLVCFSPESFVRIENNEILSYPMKGTIDATLPDAENCLLQNHKETCEHHTIVDLIRNDLNIVATRVQVKRLRYVEKIHTSQGEILQTSSGISGHLPDGWQNELGTPLFKLLPADSISGAPKAATQKLIRQAEGLPRGYYSGIFGYFDGRFIHPELHWQRITDTQLVHFGNSTFLPLSSLSLR